MTQDVLFAKLSSLARLLDRLESRTHLSSADLENSPDEQDIVMLNLERIIQTCMDLATFLCVRKLATTAQSGSDAFRILAEADVIDSQIADRLRKSVGFRNLAVHEYTKLDFRVVADILNHHLQDFRDFAAVIAKLT